MVVVVGETLTEPDVPEAVKLVPVHEVASVDDHDKVDDWPVVIDVGFAVRVAVGVAAVTETVAEALAEPPFPVQVIEYVVVWVGVTVTEPLVPLAVKPLPVQEEAVVELQVRVDDPPEAMLVGEAVSVTVGAGGPPLPLLPPFPCPAAYANPKESEKITSAAASMDIAVVKRCVI